MIPKEAWRGGYGNVRGIPAGLGSAALCQFKPTIEPTITPKRSRLVITVAVGKSREMLKLSAPAMGDYAERIGADFLALTTATQSWPLAEKFRLGTYVAQYERTLYVDADVFIRPSAPDIFGVVPAGTVGIHDDARGSANPVYNGVEGEQLALANSQGVPVPSGCWNSGVVVCDRADAWVWAAPERPFPVTHCSEQHWVQRNVLLTERVFSLPEAFNFQWWMHPTFEGVEDAHFVHLAGVGQQCPAMALPLMRALTLE